MLGPFDLERDGAVIDTARWQRRVRSLFTYLVTAPELRRLRDEAIDTFWPESPPETGGANLRLVAHRLRLALGSDAHAESPPTITLDQGWIALNTLYAWDVDLHRFADMALHAGDDVAALQAALTLYRGEPLAEERYEDWATPIREHVERTWRQTALRLSSLLQDRGSHEDSLRWSEQVLENDPIDEEAMRGVLTSLYRVGRRVEALRRYRQFEERLAEEIEALPSPETVRLLTQLDSESPDRAAQASPSHDHPLPIGQFLGALPEGPLVARDEELERILFTADLVESGTGRLILLHGERGSGKTRLAQETMVRLRDRRFTVLAARFDEHLQQVPLHVVRELTEPLDDNAAWRSSGRSSVPGSASDSISPVDSAEQQRLVAAVGDLLTALTEDGPTALLLDDLQWSDPASLALVQHLARRGGGRRLLLLGTYCDEHIGRDHPLHRAVVELAREGLVERVPVRRLSLEGTSALVHVLVGEVEAADEFVEFVFRKTRGNPYYIHRMLQTLGGRYALIRQIGIGGMGRVFEALDSGSGEPVAVKIMFARTEADPRALQRFEQEGKILASLDHPNIVAVHGTYLDEFTNAIVMELLPGTSLGNLMRETPLSFGRTRHLALQVTSALAFAHGHGVVHRDVKPDNIMVMDGDLVKVTDFGIARLARPRTSLTTAASTGLTLGTPLYMAPEQIEGRRVDGRTDIYSLGAVLYHATTGEPPFRGDDPMAIALKHVHEAPIPPHTIDPSIPPDWEALILRALAKDPADRFQSAEAMGAALASLGTQPVEVEPVSLQIDAWPAEAAGAGPRPPIEVQTERGLEIVPSTATGGRRGPRSGRTRLAAGGAGAIAALVLAAVIASRADVGPFSARSPARTTHAALVPPRPARTATRYSSSSTGTGPGQFRQPNSVAVDRGHVVYATDGANGNVQLFTSGGTFLRAYGSAGQGRTQFFHPTQLAVGRDGVIYVADYSNDRIQRIIWTGRGVTFLPPLTWRPQGRLKAVDFNGVAVDALGNVYAAAVYQNVVVKFGPTGGVLKTWGGAGYRRAQFYGPNGVAVGPGNVVYVADTLNNRIQEFTATGGFLHKWKGTGTSDGYFDGPQAVAVDPAGNVYVADTKNDRIMKFSPQRRFLASIGTTGHGCDEMIRPSGVAVDRDGSIYVSDWGNTRIDKFSASGKPLWYTAGRHAHLCGR